MVTYNPLTVTAGVDGGLPTVIPSEIPSPLHRLQPF